MKKAKEIAFSQLIGVSLERCGRDYGFSNYGGLYNIPVFHAEDSQRHLCDDSLEDAINSGELPEEVITRRTQFPKGYY